MSQQPPRPHPQQQPPQPPPPPAKQPRARKWPWILGIMISFGLGAAIGSAADDASNSPRVTDQGASDTDSDSDSGGAEEEQEDDGTVGDGIHEVGVDIDPGQYKTDGPSEESGNCYYSRSSDNSGDLDSVVDNGNTEGPASITIEAEEFVELNGGCSWELQ